MDGWRLTVNLLYIVVVLLLATILYLILSNSNILYKTVDFSTYFNKLIPKKNNSYEINIDNKTYIQPLFSQLDIQTGDDGNIVNEIEEICAFVAYLYASELYSSSLATIAQYFTTLDKTTKNFTALYNMLPIFIVKKDFAMSAEMLDISTQLVSNALLVISEDANTRNYDTIIAYCLTILGFGTANDTLREAFATACKNVVNIKIVRSGEMQSDPNITTLYTNGSFATEGFDDGANMAYIIPRLYCINYIKDSISNSDFNLIPKSHEILAKSFTTHFLRHATIYDPTLSSISAYEYLNINLALLMQGIYSIFTPDEIKYFVVKLARSDITIKSDQLSPFILYAPGYALWPQKLTVQTTPTITKELFEFSSPNQYTTVHGPLQMSIHSRGSGLPIYLDINDHYLGGNQLYMNNEAADWKVDNVTSCVDKIGDYLVGFMKLGSSLKGLGLQDMYFVSTSNSMSFLNVFSNMSYNNTGGAIDYTIMEISCGTYPEIITHDGRLSKLEELEEGYTVGFKIVANSPASLNYINDEQPQSWLISCSQDVYVYCKEEGPKWRMLLKSSTLSNITVTDESATVTYKYLQFTISKPCQYLPERLAKLYFTRYGSERNVIHYNDHNAINHLNIYTSSINSTIFTNLTIVPNVSSDVRAGILLVDTLSIFSHGVAFFDTNLAKLKSIANSLVKETRNHVSEAKNIKVVVK